MVAHDEAAIGIPQHERIPRCSRWRWAQPQMAATSERWARCLLLGDVRPRCRSGCNVGRRGVVDLRLGADPDPLTGRKLRNAEDTIDLLDLAGQDPVGEVEQSKVVGDG